ncbi:MAG: TIGR01841 family phasin [Roseiarcus sp.]|jgi:phasin family protein
MAQETQSFIDTMKKFGSDLGLPKVDVDKVVEAQRKNLEALGQSALVASEGAKALAAKQKEMVDGAFRHALEVVREFKPTGNPQEVVAEQTELARKAFDAAIANARDVAELVKKSNADAFKIIGDRITESVAEIRGKFESGSDAKKTP